MNLNYQDFAFFRSKFSENNEVVISDIEIQSSSPIIFERSFLKCKSLTFKGVSFSRKLILKNFKLEGGIHFFDCRFNDGVEIYGIELGNNKGDIYNIVGVHPSLEFHRSSFSKGGLSITKGVFKGAFYFEDTHHIIPEGVEIHYSVFKGSSYITRAHIYKRFSLLDNKFGEFIIGDNKFNCPYSQMGNEFKFVQFNSNICESSVSIFDKSIQVAYIFHTSTFKGQVSFEPIEPKSYDSALSIENCTFEKEFVINYYREIEGKPLNYGCHFINIYSNIFNSGLFINGYKSEQPNNQTDLKGIVINASNKFEGFLKISNFKNTELKIGGENIKGNLSFKNITLKGLYIEGFTNYSNLQFTNCKSIDEETTVLKIVDSSFEKTRFTNCNLGEFKNYFISHNDFTNIRSSSTHWFDYDSLTLAFKDKVNIEELTQIGLLDVPKEELNTPINNAFKRINNSQIRETFRQLKYAMEAQGDRIQALKFKGSEMKAYYNYVTHSKKGSISDWIILWLGKTNNFGQSWLKPLLILLVGMLFVFYPLIVISSHPQLHFFRFNFNSFGYTISEICKSKFIIPELFNPTHFLDKMLTEKGFERNLSTNSWDFFSKVYLSFFLFQIVSAFRKFVK